MKIIDNNKFDIGTIVDLEKHKDSRGFFIEIFKKKKLKSANINIDLLQINHSFSLKKNTIRGMHFQNKPFSQAKLIYVVNGSILDVFIDLRKKQPTYGKVNTIKLSSKNPKLLLIPEYCAHGFCSLEDNTSVIYFTTNYYNKKSEETIKFNDPYLNIPWPDFNSKVKISKKDLQGKSFSEINY